MEQVSLHNPRGKAVFIVTTTTFVLATVFVLARLIGRFGIVKSRTWDDWFIITAWLLALGLAVTIDYGTNKGLGKHDVDILPSDLPGLYQAEYAFTIIYNIALMATKTSILIFYLRMSRNTKSILRIASYVTLGIVNTAGVVLTFLNAFRCSPPSAAYKPGVDGKCMSIVTLFLCSAPVNIITDLAILILPMPVLSGMRLPQRQKFVLIFTFGLGFFVTVVDVLRIVYLQKASNVRSPLTAKTQTLTGQNFYWNASTALMWSTVEVNVGIICACVPTIKPLITRILPASIAGRTKPTANKATYASEFHSNTDQSTPLPPVAPSELQLPPPAELTGDQEGEMDMMDFLSASGPSPSNVATRPARHITQTSRENTVYFGFIDMKRPKSMLLTRGAEATKYCLTVTILFFLWGFSYGLLNILNNEIAIVAHYSRPETIGLSAAYFVGYLFGPLTVGQWTLRYWGFKATFICGLAIYAVAAIMFWPAAVLASFPGFMICQFVAGFALSVLETAANPFLALCGSSRYSECRLLLAQGVQGIGTILSQLLAQKALFIHIERHSLVDIQWIYLAITMFACVLGLFFYYMPLPEVEDSELQQHAEALSIFPTQTIGTTNIPVIFTTLTLAIFAAQFTYVAAQESHSVWFEDLINQLSPPPAKLTITTKDFALVGHTTFALGRFIFAPLCLVIRPRILLLVSILLSAVFAILTMTLQVSGNGIAGPALLFFFFEGPGWPLIFALGLRGMGRWTKWAASGLTAAASGGAIFPFVMYAVQKVDGKTVQYSYCVIIALVVAGALFPLYLTAVPAARHQVDYIKPPILGDETAGQSQKPQSRRISRRISEAFAEAFSKIGKGKSHDNPIVEHREGKRQ